MNILYHNNLIEKLAGSHLLLDTCALIDATRNEDFLDFLMQLSMAECTLLIIPPVYYEFTRTAKTQEELDRLKNMLDKLYIANIDLPYRKDISEQFLFAYNRKYANKKDSKAPSYTDSQLCLCARIYNGRVKILTANHRDIPLGLFEREEFITFGDENGVQTECIYSVKPNIE